MSVPADQTPANPTPQAQATPPATVSGSLDSTVIHTDPPAPAPAPETPPAPAQTAPAQKQVFLGDKVFNTQEEAIAYAQALAERVQQPANPAASAAINAPSRPKVSDLLFEDPEAALALHEQQILDRIEAKNVRTSTEKQIWDGFFEAHPDLKEHRDEVEFNRQKHWGQIANLPITQSLPYLAAQTRSYLSKIRGTAGQGQQLPSKPAIVAGSSGATPPAQQSQAAKTTSFVDELNAAKAMRKRKS